MVDKVLKSETEWQQSLSPEAYRVLRKKGTERAFTNDNFPKLTELSAAPVVMRHCLKHLRSLIRGRDGRVSSPPSNPKPLKNMTIAGFS